MEKSVENRELRLDHRHLLLFFLGAIVVCASFFALGFVVGRGQAREVTLAVGGALPDELLGSKSAGKVNLSREIRAEAAPAEDRSSSPKSGPEPKISTDYRQKLDFYNAVKNKNVDENFRPRPPQPQAPNQKQARSREPSARPASKPKGMLRLQVAALRNRADADRLAEKLRVKGYPVFVVSPAKTDSPKWIRVQVGPFSSAEKTSQVKAQLARDGYQSILRR